MRNQLEFCRTYQCPPPRFQIGDSVQSTWRDANTGIVHTDKGVITGMSIDHASKPLGGSSWVYQVDWYVMGLSDVLGVPMPCSEDAYDYQLEPDASDFWMREMAAS